MRDAPQKAQKMIGWIWSHASAGAALALIILALIVGFWIGSPSAKDSEGSVVSENTQDANQTKQMYTCSMHPTVRLEDPNAKCPICFMDLIPVTESAGGEENQRRLILSESARVLSQIETTEVRRSFPTATVRLYGKLAYDETSVARISAYFPGRIERLFVNYVGVTVQEGDHLAELYSPELLATFAELEQAKISFDNAAQSSEFLRRTAKQTLDAARDKLRLFGVTPEQIVQIEAGTFDSDLLTMYSPIGGVVTALGAREGDYLNTGDAIATVADLSLLWLDLEAYESQLPLLRWGVPVTFTVEAHPGEVFEGRVSFIEPIVDERTRTAAVRVSVDNTDFRLKPGMFVTAVAHPKISADGAVLSDEMAGRWVSPMHPTIVKDEQGECDICGMDLVPAESLGIVGDAENAVMPMIIPRSAVLFTGKRSVVYVQVPDADRPTYEGRSIELGPLAGEYYTVRSGLSVGEMVVTHGAFRIDSAMQILAKPSMMMPSGGQNGTGHDHGGMDGGDTDMQPMPIMQTELPADSAILDELDPIYRAYLDGQMRLAMDDLDGFLAHAKQLGELVYSAEVVGLDGEAALVWNQASQMLVYRDDMATIEDARARFEHMSTAVMNLQEQFGHRGVEVWSVAFCPMAFGSRGAKWVQRGVEIFNPYFGDSMLRCGEIQQALAPLSTDEHEGHAHD